MTIVLPVFVELFCISLHMKERKKGEKYYGYSNNFVSL